MYGQHSSSVETGSQLGGEVVEAQHQKCPRNIGGNLKQPTSPNGSNCIPSPPNGPNRGNAPAGARRTANHETC